ncbi:MAG: UDP-N-acetylmuramoyl-L-alanine--D-glutamate ligase [Pelagibacteraceae bacterium]
MNSINTLRTKTFAIYGLGVTGKSVIKFFQRNQIKKYASWDDLENKRNNFKKNINKKKFAELLNKSDFIVLSPGIKINECQFSKTLLKNKSKIITDLDIFYLINKNIKSIVVTGSNGKSTTCKILENLLRKNKFKVKLGGNIGKPILNLKYHKNIFYIIEASSFQLAYSKLIKPLYALILNITKDHLDWHLNMKNYSDSKFKIFSLQKKNNYALLSNKNLIKKFKKKKYLSNLRIVKLSSYKKIKKDIKSKYLKLNFNDENMSFAYEISKVLKIKKNSFIKSLENFKGLKHRHEIFLKKRSLVFINDSKATSFEATKYALKNNKNIYWIVGGLPKDGDKFYLKNVKKNINKVFIIGKNINFFKREIKRYLKFKSTGTLKKSIQLIFNELKNKSFKNTTILLSPASASFDQYKNFNERGNEFKNLVIQNANKYF